MKILITLVLFIAATCGAASAAVPWDNGPLAVSENGRYLQHENGQPFFWQGDTAWLLINRLDREQAAQYFQNRRDKGFNVVQCIFVQYVKHQNAYGDAPYVDGDLTRPAITPGNDPADPVHEAVNAWWYDPRTGHAHAVGQLPNRGTHRFDPPTTPP